MTNYEFLTDKKIIYLSYMAKKIKEIENKIFEYFMSSRDAKLQLLIGDDLPKLKEQIDTHLNKIKKDFNDFNINDIDSINIQETERIAGELDKLFSYFEYVVKRMEEIEIEKIDGGGNQTS